MTRDKYTLVLNQSQKDALERLLSIEFDQEEKYLLETGSADVSWLKDIASLLIKLWKSEFRPKDGFMQSYVYQELAEGLSKRIKDIGEGEE